MIETWQESPPRRSACGLCNGGSQANAWPNLLLQNGGSAPVFGFGPSVIARTRANPCGCACRMNRSRSRCKLSGQGKLRHSRGSLRSCLASFRVFNFRNEEGDEEAGPKEEAPSTAKGRGADGAFDCRKGDRRETEGLDWSHFKQLDETKLHRSAHHRREILCKVLPTPRDLKNRSHLCDHLLELILCVLL